MSNYSPFKAAIAQLHTPEAIAYYKLCSEQDAQAVAIATVKIGAALYEAAVMAYNLGVFVQALYESSKPAPEVTALAIAQTTAIEVYKPAAVEVINAEIVEDAPVLFLSAAPEISVTTQAVINQAWITANIAPVAPKALPAAKAKVGAKASRKPKESKGTPAPKRKPAGIAGQKKPTTIQGVAIN
jgi:hypothetical protein